MGKHEQQITLKGVLDEDFVNYRVPSMTLMFPKCSFKCGKELCQNSPVALLPDVRVSVDSLVDRYLRNPISGAVVCQGLEPMDSFEEMVSFLSALRQQGCMDDFVIYTGYNPVEVSEQILVLRQYENVIVKYGRYIPGQEPHMDEVLGVKLASDNQFAEVL